jgi:hypothetical protein
MYLIPLSLSDRCLTVELPPKIGAFRLDIEFPYKFLKKKQKKTNRKIKYLHHTFK